MHTVPIVFVCTDRYHAQEALRLHDTIFHDAAILDDWRLAVERIRGSPLVPHLFSNVQMYAIAHGVETGIFIGYKW